MNKAQMAKNVGKWVKLYPPALNSSVVNGDWFISAFDKDTGRTTLQHSATGHVFCPFPDNVHSWENDPVNPQRGILHLNGYIRFDGCNLEYRPRRALRTRRARRT